MSYRVLFWEINFCGSKGQGMSDQGILIHCIASVRLSNKLNYFVFSGRNVQCKIRK